MRLSISATAHDSMDSPIEFDTAFGRSGRRQFFVLVAIVALAIPPLFLPALALAYLTNAVIMSVAVLGVNLMAGFVGRVALGHGAFVGTGAYVTVILSADHHWPILATVLAAAVFGFALGTVIAIPALRIRGLHLALVSLAFGAAFGPAVKRLETLTNGANGKGSTASWVAPTWLGEGRDADMRWWFLAVVVTATIVFVLIRNLTEGRVGRALVALRDNELAAKTSGVAVRRYTVAMFGVSAAVAAIAGSLLMIRQPFASYLSFETTLSLQLFAVATFGGIASIRGALIGGIALIAVPFILRRAGVEIDSSIVFGALLILAVSLFPDGLAGRRRRGTSRTRDSTG